jgi:hypothetical protein
MHRRGSIFGREVEAENDFIVFSPCCGLIAECGTLAAAKIALESNDAALKESNEPSDAAIFRWRDENWTPALSLYEIQEWVIRKDPTRAVHLP